MKNPKKTTAKKTGRGGGGRKQKTNGAAAAPEKDAQSLGDAAGAAVDAAAGPAQDPRIAVVVKGKGVDLVNGRFKTTTSAKVRAIASTYNDMRTAASEASGEVGSYLLEQKEKFHLNVPMFKLAMKFKKMSSDKLARDYPTFLKYLDDLGVPEAALAQAGLPLGDDPQGDIEDKTGEKSAAEKGEEANAAATGLVPGKPARPPSMRIVDNAAGNDAA